MLTPSPMCLHPAESQSLKGPPHAELSHPASGHPPASGQQRSPHGLTLHPSEATWGHQDWQELKTPVLSAISRLNTKSCSWPQRKEGWGSIMHW